METKSFSTLDSPASTYDRETGLYYNNNRDYNPSTGGYIQPDPVRDARESAYRYARNNPTKYLDPEGLETTVLFSRDRGVPHVAYRVYDEVNGQHFNDLVYTNDSKNNFHPVPYAQYSAAHTIRNEIHLNTTVAEDQQFREFWVRNQDLRYAAFLNGQSRRDCASVTAAGINNVRPWNLRVPEQRFPRVLEKTLVESSIPLRIEPESACLPSPGAARS
jgi:RHS repeat-associated protein